jgi:hypothetical protein
MEISIEKFNEYSSRDVTAYECIAPNYLQEIMDKEGDLWDGIKETMFEKFKGRFYTKPQIKAMSEQFGFNVWKGMIWCEKDFRNKILDFGESAGSKYRLHGFKNKLTSEEIDKISRPVKYSAFYSKAEIEKISKRLNIDLLTACEWQEFEEIKVSASIYNINFTLFQKKDELII